jgi:hypothetical protein
MFLVFDKLRRLTSSGRVPAPEIASPMYDIIEGTLPPYP